MNLQQTLDLYGGGPGSGCQGSNCGRPPGSGHPEDHSRYTGERTVANEKDIRNRMPGIKRQNTKARFERDLREAEFKKTGKVATGKIQIRELLPSGMDQPHYEIRLGTQSKVVGESELKDLGYDESDVTESLGKSKEQILKDYNSRAKQDRKLLRQNKKLLKELRRLS